MTLGAWILLAAVLLTVGFGVWRARVDGRFTGTHPVRGAAGLAEEPAVVATPESVLAGTAYAERLGERATLLQFSSAFCAPCRATRVVLGEVAGPLPGVAHVEIDAEHHLDLVRRLGVTRTPTTLVLDASGRERARAAGAPTREQVTAALAAVESA